MKTKVVVLAALIYLAASFPASANKGTERALFLESAVTMNGAAVPHGMYELTLEPNGAGVQVTLRREGQFVATAQGTWVKSGMKFKESAVLVRVNPDGTRAVLELRLAGTDKSIVLNNPQTVVQVSQK